jgi:hypothetical protein
MPLLVPLSTTPESFCLSSFWWVLHPGFLRERAEDQGKTKGVEVLFKEIIAVTFPDLLKDTNLPVQEVKSLQTDSI